MKEQPFQSALRTSNARATFRKASFTGATNMKLKCIALAGVAIATMGSALPAMAAPLSFTLTGSREASFVLDSNPTPTSFSSTILGGYNFGDQISFDNVAGTFGGTPGFASIGFGTGIFATLNVGSPTLAFAQFVGPDLFSGTAANPVFTAGTYNLTSIVSGASTLTISSLTSAAPEPGTWIMMILGFGMAGFGLRYRRRSTSVSYS
jgi:hypothetical protein